MQNHKFNLSLYFIQINTSKNAHTKNGPKYNKKWGKGKKYHKFVHEDSSITSKIGVPLLQWPMSSLRRRYLLAFHHAPSPSAAFGRVDGPPKPVQMKSLIRLLPNAKNSHLLQCSLDRRVIGDVSEAKFVNCLE